MSTEKPISAANLLNDQNETLNWIHSQPADAQHGYAAESLDLLLFEAGQPKSTSGNACLRLCSFVEQCSKSDSPILRQWAFSEPVTVKLMTFYVEWNESDQHRSMKLVLDLISQLRKSNPDQEAAVKVQRELETTLVSIVIGTSTKPAAKSAIKTLDHFLSKGVTTLDDLKSTLIKCRGGEAPADDEAVWQSFFTELFGYLRIHYICPVAGRLIVVLYRHLRLRTPSLEVQKWHGWLLDFLKGDPQQMEAVKNYIYVPLFKLDRGEALTYLRSLQNRNVESAIEGQDLDVATLLQLAALENGKKVGLVEEPALSTDSNTADASSPLILQEKTLTSVLSHPSHEVRSLALSLLITSPSTTKPYSSGAFGLLRKHLHAYFSDADAKFRVDAMAKAREMYKRVRGSICVLKRSIKKAKSKAEKLQRAAISEQQGPKEGKEAQPAMYHANLIALPTAQLENCLEYHLDFLRWYITFLQEELIPTASYQRHIGSLKALYWVLRMESESGKSWETADDQEIFFDLFDQTWARALFDLSMDPFDDVRNMSTTCLKMILGNPKYRNFTLEASPSSEATAGQLEDLLKRANEVSRRTARADHSDGSARISQLVYNGASDHSRKLSTVSTMLDQLEAKLRVAEKDLGRAVMEASIHADFAALQYVWQVVSVTKFEHQELESMEKIQERLVDYCERIWVAVRYILCDDSPEGHLPEELEEVDGLTTKDVLSYSFRSIHESSNLMRALILTTRNRSKQGLLTPSAEAFSRIGNLTFEQLSTLRHRGAFTTVSTTFATCCQQCKHLDTGDQTIGGDLLNSWYKGTMEAIHAQASTTRRSAGIPSLMTGILSANATQPSFEDVIAKLISIAGTEAFVRETDGSNLPQVHAFNCLKEIFRNSLLTAAGNKSETYLASCLELAANSLKSEVWAIRNCSLILLRSLIDRLLGVHESKSMIEAGWDGKANRIHYHRYPTLPNVLVNLLKSGHQMLESSSSTTDTSGAVSVFPALDIVRRAGPPALLREEIEKHVARYLSSPVWHVREMAARTLCSCLLHDGWLRTIKALLGEAVAVQGRHTLNHVHGILLALKFVIERLREVAPDQIAGDLSDLVSFLKDTTVDQRYGYSREILSAYIEVVNQVSDLSITYSSTSDIIAVSVPSQCGSALLKIQVAKYQIYSAHKSSNPIQTLKNALINGKNGADTMAAAMELVPKLWKTSSLADSTLVELCEFYLDVCLTTEKTEPQVEALLGLTDILNHLLCQKKYDVLQSLGLLELWKTLPFRSTSPSLSDAILGISGSICAFLLHFKKIAPAGVHAWGSMIADAGLDDKTFDTRFAATESLASFFAATTSPSNSEEFLPALLALYDALNDDDDEVRDVASTTVRSILGETLVPVEAAGRFLEYLSTAFGTSPAFRLIVATRLTGEKSVGAATWAPAAEKLDAALKVDDSLFVIEEQNLFIDEIREAKRWVSVYKLTTWDATSDSSSPLAKLDEWLCVGLTRLQGLFEQDDGPLGWASDPQVFAVCSQLIICSVGLVEGGHASSELREHLAHLQSKLQSSENKRISGLITTPLQQLQV